MHYFLIAGEASGDLHGSHLIEALRAADPEAVVTFLGGDQMAAAAGEAPIVHYRDMAYMGFSEVLRNIGKIGRNMRAAKDALEMAAPDALILIDYPSFNLKVAARAADLRIPAYYYISPKLWAWKKWRLRTIRRIIRHVYCILPFEPAFYAANGYHHATYVGNPSVAEIDADLATALPRPEFLAKYRLRDRTLIALMPGSRSSEIRNNLPHMAAAVDTFPQYRGIIIGAPGIADEAYAAAGAKNIPVLRGEPAAAYLSQCRAALVTSGTATLEAALANIPQVVCYRANGSEISYKLMERVLDIDFVSLPNLIAGHEIVPELLLHNCTAERIAEALAPLLRPDSDARRAQLEGYVLVRTTLGTAAASTTTASAIIADLRQN